MSPWETKEHTHFREFLTERTLPVFDERYMSGLLPGRSVSVVSKENLGCAQLLSCLCCRRRLVFFPVLFWKCNFFLLRRLPCHFVWDVSNLSDVFCVCSLLLSATCLVPVLLAREPDFIAACQHCSQVLQQLSYFVLCNRCFVSFFILISSFVTSVISLLLFFFPNRIE